MSVRFFGALSKSKRVTFGGKFGVVLDKKMERFRCCESAPHVLNPLTEEEQHVLRQAVGLLTQSLGAAAALGYKAPDRKNDQRTNDGEKPRGD